MNDDVRNIVLGVIAAGISTSLGWFARTYLWRRQLRRKQDFFGLPKNAECVLVVNREAGGDRAVARHDVFTLLELSALIKDCGAHARIVAHDAAQQGFGERTEFCVGGPASNLRMVAHMRSLLPGMQVNVDTEPGPDRGAFRIGGERYRMEAGRVEHVVLARLTAGMAGAESRPVFLFCGQRAIANQAASRYLVRNYPKLARKYGKRPFVLLLKVVNSQAYGPDVVELAADVTAAAMSPMPEPTPTSHRASP
ncbi:hypothetical protein [Streptomyces sp. GC420]|uniref:hypothetical protein n=1 Tax=Streptomyces sp. GC420 TaxID=2697568 RepID=UPI001414DF74|nr:hypothetical protein [Streptomyces sp. GC420]NBM19140.1 hypothetical protein [Streptomyces sp. GC420]